MTVLHASMPGDGEPVAALAALLRPERAEGLLAHLPRPEGREAAVRARFLASRPARERLAALELALGPGERDQGSSAAIRAVSRARRRFEPGDGANRSPPPRLLPFELPHVSCGHAALTRGLRALGSRLAAEVGSALSGALGAPVELAGRALPARALAGAGSAAVSIALETLGARATLEVEAGFLSSLLGLLSGGEGDGAAPAALVPSEGELLLLRFLALVALEAAHAVGLRSLAPRLLLDPPWEGTPRHALCVALDFTAGDRAGRGRLFVPAEVLRALAVEEGPAMLGPWSEVVTSGSVRSAFLSLTAEELGALAPGDVLLLDRASPGEPASAELALPGGLTFRGRLGGEGLVVEEVVMTEPKSSYPIVLGVEIARVTLRLGELAQLEPGSSLPLGVPAGGAVVLRAGEHAVARGELVDLDGALGVRIVRIGEGL